MKRIIIFKEQPPENQTEIRRSIQHFCQEHDFQYQFSNKRKKLCLSIDGADYQTRVVESMQDAEHYWMIECTPCLPKVSENSPRASI